MSFLERNSGLIAIFEKDRDRDRDLNFGDRAHALTILFSRVFIES